MNVKVEVSLRSLALVYLYDAFISRDLPSEHLVEFRYSMERVSFTKIRTWVEIQAEW